MKDVLLTNAAYQVVSRVPWQRAIVLVVTDQVDVVESHPIEVVHSQRLSIPLPTIIRQRRYVHVPHLALPQTEAASRASILLRDRRTCAYCGSKGADTIDHVFPKSRGGLDVWANLVAACKPCNNDKGDRTPIEWGRQLLWMPYAPSLMDADQDRVWLALAEAA